MAVVPLMMTFDGRATEMWFEAFEAVGKWSYWETSLTSNRSDCIPHEEYAPILQHGTVAGVREGVAIAGCSIEECGLFCDIGSSVKTLLVSLGVGEAEKKDGQLEK